MRVTIAAVLVKVAEQPESHSCPMDNKLPEAKEGNKWTDVAELGRDGKLIFAVWVDLILELLGRRTSIPSDVGVTFWR